MISKLTSGYAVDKLLANGGTDFLDLISGAAFTMTGTPTTASLLGATAPVISATAYTSCKIATPFSAGQALSIMCVLKTPWAGNDGGDHHIFNMNATAPNSMGITKEASNKLYFVVTDAAGKYKDIGDASLSALEWAANINHVVICTRDATGVLTLTLDGVAKTDHPYADQSGATGLESSVPANVYFGTRSDNTLPINSPILCAIWGRVLSAGERTALSSLASWNTLTDLTISGVSTGNAGRVFSGVTLKDSGVETGGIITLTPAGPNRIIKVYEDNTYAAEIDELVGT